jgi:hypothetical protein
MTSNLNRKTLGTIVFEKLWIDPIEDFFEIGIVAASPRLIIVQTSCYVTRSQILEIADSLMNYHQSYPGELMLDLDDASHMRVLPSGDTGDLHIEVDIRIPDSDDASHRCAFFIVSELGLLESFGKRLKHFADAGVGHRVSLLEGWLAQDSSILDTFPQI